MISISKVDMQDLQRVLGDEACRQVAEARVTASLTVDKLTPIVELLKSASSGEGESARLALVLWIKMRRKVDVENRRKVRRGDQEA